MKNLEYFKKKQAESTLELENLAGNLDKLQQNRADLEEQINNAIDAEDQQLVERLTAKEAELDNRIRAAEKILDRKKQKAMFAQEELAEACNAELATFQARCNSAMEEAQEIRKKYLGKLLEAAKIVNEARTIRKGYLELAEIDTRDAWRKDNIGGFIRVHAPFPEQFNGAEVELLRKIQQDAVTIIQAAR